jgi:hypothetical protein
VPEEVRDELAIHLVDRFDEVLTFALEDAGAEEKLDTPQVWGTKQPGADISTSVD